MYHVGKYDKSYMNTDGSEKKAAPLAAAGLLQLGLAAANAARCSSSSPSTWSH